MRESSQIPLKDSLVKRKKKNVTFWPHIDLLPKIIMLFREFGFLFILCQKLPSKDTEITQSQKQVHRSTRWHMKDNGHTYIFVKRSVLYQALFNHQRVLKLGWNALISINSQIFPWFLGGKYLFFIRHYNCWIYLDLDLSWV